MVCAGYAQTLGSDTASNSPLPDLFKVLLTKTPDGVLVPYSVEGYQPVHASSSGSPPLPPPLSLSLSLSAMHFCHPALPLSDTIRLSLTIPAACLSPLC